MNHPNKESTIRYLRKKHKDWSEAKIEDEATKIWEQYYTDNKERLEKLKKDDETAFKKAVDMEFLNLLMDSSQNER